MVQIQVPQRSSVRTLTALEMLSALGVALVQREAFRPAAVLVHHFDGAWELVVRARLPAPELEEAAARAVDAFMARTSS